MKGEETLKAAAFTKLSICDPVAAPYGAAAVETMKALKLYDALQPKLVEGANISQAFQFVDTGNAELGFVALSQLTGNNGGSRWLVPQDLYTPIKQDAVLLKKGADNAAAKAFMTFLKGPEATAIIEKYGYALDDAELSHSGRLAAGYLAARRADDRTGGDHDGGPAGRRHADRLVAGALARLVEGGGRHRRRAAAGAAADRARLLSAGRCSGPSGPAAPSRGSGAGARWPSPSRAW